MAPGARHTLAAVLLACTLAGGTMRAQDRVVVGSKNFTESHLLGELLAQLLAARTDLAVEHRSGLGGSMVCWAALQSGGIDVYPEYTGTAWSVLLKEPETVHDPLRTFLHVQRRCEELYDVTWLQPFGLDNTYALAMREVVAERLGVRTISDLAAHADGLRMGLSIEFMNRADGWPGLAAAYGLGALQPRTLEHALAYEAVAAGDLDVVDAYSTDGKLLRLPLRVLVDDRGFFPPYHAAPVVRGALLRAHPEVRDALDALAFALPDATMIELNHAVEVEGRDFAAVARDFLVAKGLLHADAAGRTAARDRGSLWQFAVARLGPTLQLGWQHLLLSLAAVLLAILVAVPLGIWVAPRRLGERVALGAAAVIQTVPSLALLAFLIAIPGFGLTVRSAIAALFLYALLPILRNTVTGLRAVDPELIDAATGIGLTDRQILLRVRLPLAVATILAGIRTATVISIGVATLAAFIGAGGLGEPIVTGLYLNDTRLILAGAVPAALLALLADRGLGALERRLVPRGLRSC